MSPTDTGYHKGKYLPLTNTLYNPISFIAIAYNTKIFLILPTPHGVGGRNIDLTLVKKILNWKPKTTFEEGLEKTYKSIETKLREDKTPEAIHLAKPIQKLQA